MSSKLSLPPQPGTSRSKPIEVVGNASSSATQAQASSSAAQDGRQKSVAFSSYDLPSPEYPDLEPQLSSYHSQCRDIDTSSSKGKGRQNDTVEGKAVKADEEELNDGEGFITRPKQTAIGPHGTKGVVEGWCTHPDMVIIRYGPRNTPIYKWRRGKASQEEKSQAP